MSKAREVIVAQLQRMTGFDAECDDGEDADAILAALAAAGLAVVPVEPTKAMTDAGNIDMGCRRDCTLGLLNTFAVYRAMISAAQEPTP